MKIAVALDSFKGSLTSKEACFAVKEGILQATSCVDVKCMPISDGGDGFIDALYETLVSQGYKAKNYEILGPYGEKIQSCALIKGDTCIIEIAQCCGILQAKGNLDINNSTSYGVGQMVDYALNEGCSNFIIGLGGSANNDGGAGFAQALGIKFFNQSDEEIKAPIRSKDLIKIKYADFSSINKKILNASFCGTCDVSNPLLGENGATYIYGPQKGANNLQILKSLEEGMNNYKNIMQQNISDDISLTPGAGAAGGLGYALVRFCNAELKNGIKMVIELLKLEEQLKDCSLVVVGEGRLDGQTSAGKAPVGIAHIAKKYNIPVIAIGGSISDDGYKVYDHGIDALFSICNKPMELNDAIVNAKELLIKSSSNIMRTFILRK